MKIIVTLAICCLCFSIEAQDNFRLLIDFENIKYDSGTLYVAVYDSEAQFLKTAFNGTTTQVINGKARAEFNKLPAGVYAVSAFFDKNNNGKLDTNFLGIPKEPIAVSNNAKGIFGPPRFKDAKFRLGHKEQIISIKF